MMILKINVPTIIVLVILVVVVIISIISIIRKKNRCSCGCSGCPMSESCHSKKKSKNDKE